MKELFIYISCFVWLSFIPGLQAQELSEKAPETTQPKIQKHLLSKEFNAKSINELKIRNKHGFVYLSTWEEETVQVDIIVNMETNRRSDLEEFLDLVNFDNRSYAKTLQLKTVFLEDFFSNYPFTINYLVKAPARLNLNINNSIGDVKIDSITGSLTLKHSYGNLELRQLASDKTNHLDLSFTEGLVDSFGEIKANINNSTLSINNGHKLSGQTNYSMASFTDVHTLDLNTSTDRLTINRADSLSLKGTQFIGKVTDLKTALFCELKQGQLQVETGTDIKALTISNQQVKTTLVIPARVSYLINGAITNGSFTHPHPEKLNLFKEDHTISFSGKIGETETPQANLILFNEDSSITIKY